MSNFDTVWKEALDLFFEPFMSLFFAEAHREIDWARGATMLDKELQQITRDAEHGRRVVDMLAKVWRTNGNEEWVLVHIEVQSQQDADFAERMFVYNYRAFDRYNKKVASFAILGDNRPAWRPDHFSYELWGTKVGIQFATAKLLDYVGDESKLESNPNPFAVVALAHLEAQRAAHDAEARRASEVRLVKRLFERGFGTERIRQLYRLIDGMMDLPKPLATLAWQELQVFSKEKGMSFVTGAEIVGHEKGLAEGLAKGLAKGREEGRQEALQEAQRETRQSLLTGIEVALELKFAATGLALFPEIQEIDRLDLLGKILHAIKDSDTPEALRLVWSNGSRG